MPVRIIIPTKIATALNSAASILSCIDLWAAVCDIFFQGEKNVFKIVTIERFEEAFLSKRIAIFKNWPADSVYHQTKK